MSQIDLEKKIQIYPGWEEFKKKPIEERLQRYQKDNQVYDLLFSQQLSREYCGEIIDLANRIRKIAKNKEGMDWLQTLLSHKRAMLFFAQPSTRTFLSFLNACHILGIKTSEIRDTSTSSEVKGESPEDTIRTFSSYVDLIVMRHKEEGYAEKSAWLLNQTKRPVPIINGGSGKDEHPTQALLDLYTLERAFKKQNSSIEGKVIGMVGDLARGRTVRSLSRLIAHYPGAELLFMAPKSFQMKQDVLDFLDSRKVKYTLSDEFVGNIPKLDAIYMTRIQDEYDQGGESKTIDFTRYHFEKKHLEMLKANAVILHPFPRRLEIDVEVDSDPRASYWKQERNGMWTRCAIILKIFGREGDVLARKLPD